MCIYHIYHIYLFGLWPPYLGPLSLGGVLCLLPAARVSAAADFWHQTATGCKPLSMCEPGRHGEVKGYGVDSQTLPLISDGRLEITYLGCGAGNFHPAPFKSQNFMGSQKPFTVFPRCCVLQRSLSQPQLKPFFRSVRSRSGTAGTSLRTRSSGSLGPGGLSAQDRPCRWGHRSAASGRTASTIGLGASPSCWPGWGTSWGSATCFPIGSHRRGLFPFSGPLASILLAALVPHTLSLLPLRFLSPFLWLDLLSGPSFLLLFLFSICPWLGCRDFLWGLWLVW